MSRTAPAQLSPSGSTARLPPRKDTKHQPWHREKVQEAAGGGEAKSRGIPKMCCKQQHPFPAQLAGSQGSIMRVTSGAGGALVLRRHAHGVQAERSCGARAGLRRKPAAVSSAGAAALLRASLCSRSRAQDVRNGGRRGGGTREGTATAGGLGNTSRGIKGSFRSEKPSKTIEYQPVTAKPAAKPCS